MANLSTLEQRVTELLHELHAPPRRTRGCFFTELCRDVAVHWGPYLRRIHVPRDFVARHGREGEREREAAHVRWFAHGLLSDGCSPVDAAQCEVVSRALMLPRELFAYDAGRCTSRDCAEDLLALYPFALRAFIEARIDDVTPRLFATA